jgi:hypothetical protein
MNSQDFRNLSRSIFGSVYDNIMEKENSEYEKASDAALDARFGYGRASGDKRSFGRAANRSSAAALFVLSEEVKEVVVELQEKQVLMQFIKDGQEQQKQVPTKLQKRKKEEQYLLILHTQNFLKMNRKRIQYHLMR